MPLSRSNKNIFEESEEKDLVNDDKKNVELDADISSDECTSITLEDESTKYDCLFLKIVNL